MSKAPAHRESDGASARGLSSPLCAPVVLAVSVVFAVLCVPASATADVAADILGKEIRQIEGKKQKPPRHRSNVVQFRQRPAGKRVSPGNAKKGKGGGAVIDLNKRPQEKSKAHGQTKQTWSKKLRGSARGWVSTKWAKTRDAALAQLRGFFGDPSLAVRSWSMLAAMHLPSRVMSLTKRMWSKYVERKKGAGQQAYKEFEQSKGKESGGETELQLLEGIQGDLEEAAKIRELGKGRVVPLQKQLPAELRGIVPADDYKYAGREAA